MRRLISTALVIVALLGLVAPYAAAQGKASATAGPTVINIRPAGTSYPVIYYYYPPPVVNYPASFAYSSYYGEGYATVGNFPGYPKDPREYGSNAMVFDPASSAYYVQNPLNNQFSGPFFVNVPR
jgi:hypothetical protein